MTISLPRRLAFSCVPLVALLVAGEAGVRVRRGALISIGDAREAFEERLDQRMAVHDPLLGWVGTPGYRGHDLGASVSIDESSIRAAGTAPRPSGPPLLAVGDSFTFGEEVGDDQTWPAHLERRLRQQVINAGVSGYGLDQSVLRAQHLLKEVPAHTLLVSFIANDIPRNEYAFRGMWKPWFDLDGEGRLVLRGVPVPRPQVTANCSDDSLTGCRPLVTLLRHSYLADFILRRWATSWWMTAGFIDVHDHRLEVSYRLVELLNELSHTSDVRVLLVAQGLDEQNRPEQEAVVDHARRVGLPVLDLAGELITLFQSQPRLHMEYFTVEGVHMTGAGNAWVAARIAQELHARWPAVFRESFANAA